ncbi:aldehyde dehydrogenase family protein [Escherichia coli]
MCIAGTCLLLEESIADEFLALLNSSANRQPGHPLYSATTMGTLIDAPTPTRSIALFGKAKAKGNCCWMVVTLSWLPPLARPSFGCRPEVASLSREEIFGPVPVVTRFTSEDQGATACQRQPVRPWRGGMDGDLSRAHRMKFLPPKAGSVFVKTTTTAIYHRAVWRL